MHTKVIKTGQVRILIGLLLLLAVSSRAEAHLVTTGLGPVYDGIGHLLLTPQDLIAVLALCLLAGLRGTSCSRIVLFTLPLVWFVAGCLVGTWFSGFGSFPFAAISFIVLGLMVAADVKVTSRGITLLAVVLGIVHGLDNGVAMRDNSGTLGLLGILVALFVVATIACAMVVSQNEPWKRIVIRVLGSWVVATGIMMLGWHFRAEKNIKKLAATIGFPAVKCNSTTRHELPELNDKLVASWQRFANGELYPGPAEADALGAGHSDHHAFN